MPHARSGPCDRRWRGRRRADRSAVVKEVIARLRYPARRQNSDAGCRKARHAVEKRDGCSSGKRGTGEIDEFGVDVVRRNRGADPVEPGLGHHGSFVLGPGWWGQRPNRVQSRNVGWQAGCAIGRRHGHAIVTVVRVGRTSGLVRRQGLHYEFESDHKATITKLRQHLAGVHDAARVERRLDPPHQRRVPRRRASPASCRASAARCRARPRSCRRDARTTSFTASMIA